MRLAADEPSNDTFTAQHYKSCACQLAFGCVGAAGQPRSPACRPLTCTEDVETNTVVTSSTCETTRVSIGDPAAMLVIVEIVSTRHCSWQTLATRLLD